MVIGQRRVISNRIAFHVDGRRNVSIKHPHEAFDTYETFVANVPIFETEDGFATTHPKTNSIWLVEIDALASIKIWRYSVVSQRGKFFVAAEMTQQVQAHLDGDSIVFPGLEWPSLQKEILQPLFADWIEHEDGILPELPEYSPPAKPDVSDLGENEAQVLWYCIGDGVGAALISDGTEVRVNWRAIPPRENGLAHLMPGEIVEFGNIGTPVVGSRPTRFKWEIFNLNIK